MKWYTKYLQSYDCPYTQTSDKVRGDIRHKLEQLCSEHPMTSVVIIAHNEEQHLLSCLWSLVDNQFDFPIELFVVNNNSTDGTEALLQHLGVTYLNETKKGPGYARQCGLDHARGVYYLCIDADTIYPPHYIATHTYALMMPRIVGTFGLWSFMVDEYHSRCGLWLYETLRDFYLRMQVIQRPELCVRGMNFGFNKDYARQIGFRTDIVRGEDGSMAMALKRYGQLKFITSSKIRVLTGNQTLSVDGSLARSFMTRIVKAVHSLGDLLFKKKVYTDDQSNLIKGNK